MPKAGPRQYVSQLRGQSAEATRLRILEAAKSMFARRGIDDTTVAEIAERAGVAGSTIYALYKSKEGILRALMKAALFGPRFDKARTRLQGVTDPIELLMLTAQVSRAIYEGETSELGIIRGVSAFSPALRKLEQEFEKIRLDMQEERITLLFKDGKQRKGLTLKDARRILWMYTSRDVYRMLVHDGGWTPDRYQQWLSDTLTNALARTNDKAG